MSKQINSTNPDKMFVIRRETCKAQEVLCNSFDWNGLYQYPEDYAGA